MVRVVVGLAGAILFASVAVVTYSHDRSFRTNARSTVGTVYKHRIDEDDGTKVFHPVVRYVDNAGHVQTFTAADGAADAPRLKPGEKVTVLFDPAQPKQARIDTTFGRWGLPVTCGLAALLCLAFFVRPARKQ
jgi:hypothetical protein